jgi:hypothetical protein
MGRGAQDSPPHGPLPGKAVLQLFLQGFFPQEIIVQIFHKKYLTVRRNYGIF